MISTLIALDRVLPSLTTGAVGEASSLPSFQRLSVLAGRFIKVEKTRNHTERRPAMPLV